MSGPRVHDGTKYVPVDTSAVAGKPPAPVDGGDGKIFISLASYRDGERCAQTLKSIFENAKSPDDVIVGLIEQNSPEDKFCLEEYCSSYGLNSVTRRKVREGVVKIMTEGDARKRCPHYDQVRVLAFYDINAKGPILARSMARKILGNEEFCMQVDAHTDFAKGWDAMVVDQWKKTENEFAVLTNVPAPKDDKINFEEGGSEATKVPRQCKIYFRDNKFPDFMSPADGHAIDLDRPLLGAGWSAAFSFAKCHLEESAPYDNFLYYAKPIEQFSRYARFWTRGYDSYTPARNIVFHDYGEQENGHGKDEWFKHQRDRFRKASIERVKTALQMVGGDNSERAQANLGIYGLGRRRTVQQLEEFANMDFKSNKGNVGENLRCAGFNYVAYDDSISPVENLFGNPDDLDPQPEFPMRTELSYYQQVEEALPDLDVDIGGNAARADHLQKHDTLRTNDQPALPPLSLLLVLWIFGLIVWCILYLAPTSSSASTGSSRKNKSEGFKDV